MKKHFNIAVFALLCSSSFASAHNYTVSQTRIFTPQNKNVLLLNDSINQKKIILFSTNLRVNTDGSPLSYHPLDPRGKIKAINTICNAIAVRKTGSQNNLCLTKRHFDEAISVFEKFRDSNYKTSPDNYTITWGNVLAATKNGGTTIPCIFQSGPYEGYFGSLTRLKNDLTGDKGECEFLNQVNPMTTPALVLVGGENVVKDLGAQVGDLLVAYNSKTKIASAAIIGDTGPKDNLGEGSIALNMKLLGVSALPTNKAETYKLSVENTSVFIAIFPTSHLFQVIKPYNTENLSQRVEAWQEESGFASQKEFIKFIESFQPMLK